MHATNLNLVSHLAIAVKFIIIACENASKLILEQFALIIAIKVDPCVNQLKLKDACRIVILNMGKILQIAKYVRKDAWIIKVFHFKNFQKDFLRSF